MNKESMAEFENGFTLDTCVLIKILENPNFGNLLKCRINFENSKIYLNSQTIGEAKKKGYDIAEIYSTIQIRFCQNVIFSQITDEMYTNARNLQQTYSSLHYGDSQILSFAKAKSLTLVSCDKGLIKAAKQSGISFVNPDTLPCNELTTFSTIRLHKVVKDAINGLNGPKRKIIQPLTKITWEAFV